MSYCQGPTPEEISKILARYASQSTHFSLVQTDEKGRILWCHGPGDLKSGEQLEVGTKLWHDGQIWDWERRMSGGEASWYRVNTFLLNEGINDGHVGNKEKRKTWLHLIWNRTDVKSMEEELLQNERAASLGTYAGQVIHEVSNPLSGIQSYLEIMRKGLAEFKEESGRASRKDFETWIDQCLLGMGRIREIVGKWKTFSRRPSANFTSGEDLQEVNVLSVLESTLQLMLPQLQGHTRVVRNYPADSLALPLVAGQESSLGQVIMNLIINALQAFPEKSEEKNLIEVSVSRKNDRIVLGIRDNGPGIPASVLKDIFRPYFTTKPVGIGTGLGLSVCQSIIQGLGGDIKVESEVGRGTTFVIDLPALDGLAITGEKERKEYKDGDCEGQILLLDDENMIGEGLKILLEPQYQVRFTSSPREALGFLQSEAGRFDVILCDWTMPEMDGLEFFQQVKKNCPGYEENIIFMTGGSHEKSFQDLVSTLSNQWVEKPFEVEKIQEAIEKVRLARNRHA